MSIPEVFPRTPTTALDDLWAAFIDQGWVGFEAAKARYRPAIEAAARLEVEARAPLLAELRAQAFGEPRCVPLSVIERIFSALEEPTDD